MKAIQYSKHGGPDVLEMVELPDPRPAAGEVLIRVRAASVGHGDWKARQGLLRDDVAIRLPKIPGRDGAGEVVALGAGVGEFVVGQDVAFLTSHARQGGCAELIACPISAVAAKPAGLSFAEAAAVAQAGCCAWICVAEAAALTAGQSILVHGGAGAIGGLAVQIARHLGGIATASCAATDAGLVRALGADRVIAYDREDFALRPERFDAVIDVIGGDVHRRSYGVLKPAGRLVYLKAAPIDPPTDPRAILAPIRDRADVLARVMMLAASGLIRPRIAAEMPLAACAEAHRLLAAGRAGKGRIVLTVP